MIQTTLRTALVVVVAVGGGVGIDGHTSAGRGGTLAVAGQPNPVGEDPESLIRTMYDVLSGAPGDHDWALFAALFHERAIMGAAALDPGGNRTFRSNSPAEYVERTARFYRENTFDVRETHRLTEQFGDIVHVFSTYRFRAGGALPQEGSGINSIQLVRDASRWWIISIQYTNERPDLPMPARYRG